MQQPSSGGSIRPRIRRPSYTSTTGLRASPPPGGYDNQPEQPLPPPTGPSPYHLSLDQVLDTATMQSIQSSGKLVFHIVGDTGGIKIGQDQILVVERMIQDFSLPDPTARPTFFYHLGDVVYYNGEASNYTEQFYDPYEHYPAHVVAIPGNHDGSLLNPNDPSVKSLAAFVENFCSPTPRLSSEASDTGRQTMIQPNVYWTLDTPFATFIGLYTNVPEGGYLDNTQINWFNSELKSAPTNKALIVSMHHPIYSGDTFHGSSDYMGHILTAAIQSTGRVPDIVMAGHVHNYQRFTNQINGRAVPFIVAGGGGYYNLHKLEGTQTTTPYTITEGLTLESYCDTEHSYLLMTVTAQTISAQCITAPDYRNPNGPSNLVDSFTLNWQTHQVQTNPLS